MEQVVLLTYEQAKSLEGRMFDIDSYFLVQQDIHDNYFVTVFEQEHCINPELYWIKRCPRIEYKPKPFPEIKPEEE